MESPFERTDALRLLLLWEGELSRSRLIDLFRLGETRASQWIREFRDANPDWLTWDTRARRYYATYTAYKESETEMAQNERRAASLARYLALSGLFLDAPNARTDGISWAAYPELSAPSPKTFAVIRQGIQSSKVLEIAYSSMSNPAQHRRLISPHGLIRAGRRWHVRAWCEHANAYRDFALGRIWQASLLERDATQGAKDDIGWNATIRVSLIAHPGLSESKALVIRNEYFGGASSRTDQCKGCLIPYFLQDLRVAVDLDKELAPEFQLALGNPDEVRPWLIS